MFTFLTVAEALDFLANHYRKAESEKKDKQFQTLHVRVDRARYLLRLLNSPQKQQKIIHIAGTSGKGSTTTILAQLLAVHGFKVGSVTSPHIIEYNERFLINGEKIASERLLYYINKTLQAAEQIASTSFGSPHFKAINTAIAYQYFRDERVDYSVIETEMGGLYDETNTEVNSNKVSIITDLGLDHIKTLGPTLTSIAYHKAGIITTSSQNFAIWGKADSNKVLEDTAYARTSELTWVKPDLNYKVTRVENEKTLFDFNGSKIHFANLELDLIGEHQVRNTSLALRTLEYLAERDHWHIEEQKVRDCLAKMHSAVRGRIEYKSINQHDCFFDVAHNEQKMLALVQTLKAIDPHKRYTCIMSFKGSKDFSKMVAVLAPVAARFIVTSFSAKALGLPFEATPINTIINYITSTYPNMEATTASTSTKALEQALKHKDAIVVTGSFYLLAEVLPYLDVSYI